jgi:hypothetical protein
MVDLHPAGVKWVDLRLGYAMIRGELDNGGNYLISLPTNSQQS